MNKQDYTKRARRICVLSDSYHVAHGGECSNCKNIAALAEEVAQERQNDIDLIHLEAKALGTKLLELAGETRRSQNRVSCICSRCADVAREASNYCAYCWAWCKDREDG